MADDVDCVDSANTTADNAQDKSAGVCKFGLAKVQQVSDIVPQEWRLSERGQAAVEMAAANRASRYKLYSTLPIICRGRACPYAESCFLIKSDMAPDGDRCPLEIAQAVDMFQSFCAELEVQEDCYVDLALVRDLVDIEVQLSRADRIMSSDGEVVQNVAVGVTNKGQIVTRPEIHKVIDIKDKLLRRRMEILQLLNATRKDKAADEAASRMDPSMWVADLIERKKQIDAERETAERELTIDGTSRHIGEDEG